MAVSFGNAFVKRSERGLGLKPADIVVDPELRGRRFGPDADAVRSLADSIRDNGQKQNIVIRKLADGRPAVKAGFTRLEACTLLAQDDPDFLVWCTYEQGNEADSFDTTIIENLDRNDVSDIDHAHNHETYRRKYGKNDAEIARKYRWNPSKVSRLRKLLLLPESVQLALHRGEISTAAGVLLAELPPDEAQAMVSAGRVKVADIEEFIRSKSRKSVPDSAPVSAQSETRDDAQEDAQQSEENDADALDFSGIKTQDEGASKPNARTRQRTIQQTRKLLETYTKYDEATPTHPVIAVIAAGLLDYINGTTDDAGFEQLIRKLEGWK